MTTMKNRAVLYARISDDRGGNSTSVPEQVRDLRLLASHHQLTVVAVVDEDEDISASRYAMKDRPGWDRVLAMVERGEVDYVATWEQSRLMRDLGVYARFRDLCEQTGTRWLTPSGVVDLADDGNRLGTGVMALVDEQASRATAKRVRRALDARAEAGLPHGRQCYGYARTYGPDRKVTGAVIVEEEAEVLRWAAREALTGASLASLVHDLNARGVMPSSDAVRVRLGRPAKGEKWTVTSLREMLRDPRYAGLRSHHGVLTTGKWDALWTEEQHRALVAMLTNPERDKRKGRSTELRHFLSGVVACEMCHQPLRVNTARGQQMYACRTRGCYAVAISAKQAENAVRAMVTEAYRGGFKDRPKTARAAELRTEIATLKQRREDNEQAVEDGDMPPAMGGRLDARLGKRIDRLEQELQGLALPVALPDSDDVLNHWDDLSPSKQRHVVLAVLGRAEVIPAGGRRLPAWSRIVWVETEMAA